MASSSSATTKKHVKGLNDEQFAFLSAFKKDQRDEDGKLTVKTLHIPNFLELEGTTTDNQDVKQYLANELCGEKTPKQLKSSTTKFYSRDKVIARKNKWEDEEKDEWDDFRSYNIGEYCDEKDSEAIQLLVEKSKLYQQYKIDEEVLRDILDPMNNWLVAWNTDGKKRHDKNAILKKIAEKTAMDASITTLEKMPGMEAIVSHSKAAGKKLEQAIKRLKESYEDLYDETFKEGEAEEEITQTQQDEEENQITETQQEDEEEEERLREKLAQLAENKKKRKGGTPSTDRKAKKAKKAVADPKHNVVPQPNPNPIANL
jgi:hypothetical protein